MVNIVYSFIIPHHNTPELLSRLINSIPQREDVEIIIVDDNSDGDKKACVNRQDVHVIYVDNIHSKGAGKARNVGIDVAKGKWLLFADSDDFYYKDFIKILDDYKDYDIDMLFFNIESVDSKTLLPADRAYLHRTLIEAYDGSKERGRALLYETYSPWARMFNASFVKKNKIRFEEIPRTNDIFFSLQASYFAREWMVDKRDVYVVTYNKSSLTASNSFEKCKIMIQTWERVSKFYEFIDFKPEHRKRIWRFFSREVCGCIYVCLKKDFCLGVRTLFYYITHLIEIKRGSNYYVEEIKIKGKRPKV